MTPTHAWRTLGIAATAETRAIRQAYATRLRALDVDADRDGFAALRDARDLALQLAESGALLDIAEPPPSAPADSRALRVAADVMHAPLLALTDGEGGVAALPVALRTRYDASDRMAVPAEGPADSRVAPSASLRPPTLDVVSAGTVTLGSRSEKFDVHYHAIHDLLIPPGVEEPGPLTHDERVVLGAHIDAVLHDPRLAEISFYGDVSRWFANTLARACPRSDPTLARVADHFGWMTDADKIGQDPALAFVTRRQRTLDFLAAVQQSKHRLHSAWSELTRPSNEHSRRSWGVSKTRVNELLATVRRDYPDLEGALDWHRVNLWENRYNWGKTAWPVGLLIFVAFRILIAISTINPGSTPSVDTSFPPPPSPTLSAAVPDIDDALGRLFGDKLDAARISLDNPSFDKDLHALWQQAYDKHEDRYHFGREVLDLQHEHIRRGIRHASYALIADYRRLELDAARALQRHGPRPCADYFSGTAHASDIPQAIRERFRALDARILLEADTSGAPLAKAGKFAIPNTIYDETARRAHLSGDDLHRAFTFEGPSQEQCVARIALLEAALAAPRDAGLALMRTM